MFQYRLYNDGVFIKEVYSNSYDEAKNELSPQDEDKIFVVEDDNHEVECGLAWIKDLLDHGEHE